MSPALAAEALVVGIGGGIFLIALGAVLTFALELNPWWINVKATGVIIMLAGSAVLLVTLWYWHDRRRRAVALDRRSSPARSPVSAPPPDAGPSKPSPADPPPAAQPSDGT
ncbi:hypothetical protein [Phytohabitans kaempferiae]|uniref:Uncharacterized protein n=1 Tax=Phytohabitans kaempferiae TaxID=1620943 RepID=A0ABV6LXQ2_9ACTN